MAYTKLGLKDGETVRATHVDHIEDGIGDLSDDLTNIVGAKNITSLDNLVALADSLDRYQIVLVYINNTVMQALGGSSAVAKGMLTKYFSASGTFDFMFWQTDGLYIYTGRYDNGTTTLYRYNGTSISTSSVGNPVVMGEDD